MQTPTGCQLIARRVFLSTFLLACTPAQSASGTTEATGQAGTLCPARQFAQNILRDGSGQELYVEPVVHAASGTRTLLAGIPNYFHRVAAGGRAGGTVRDSIFGVVLDSAMRATVVPRPVVGLPHGMRATANGDGGWHVVFAELPANYNFPDAERILHLWYGVVTDGVWTQLENIPLPRTVRLASFNGSPLLRRGDTLSWAMKYHEGESTGVALFERRAGKWSSELISVPDLAFASLSHNAAEGLRLLAVYGVPGQSNALFAYGGGPGWRDIRPLATEWSEPVYDVQATQGAAGTVLSWWSPVEEDSTVRHEARVLLNAHGSPSSAAVPLSPEIARLVAVQTHNNAPLWVLTVPENTDDRQELRVVTHDGSRARVAGAFANPFTGPFAAIETAPDTLLLAGPLLRPEGDAPPLVSLLLRVTSQCGPK